MDPSKSTEKEESSSIDATSDRFDPLQALYAPSTSGKRADVKVYDNMAQFDAALVRVGVLGVGNIRKVEPKPRPKPTEPKNDDKKYLDLPGRRFLLHQAPVPTTGIKKRHKRTLFSVIEEMTGPLAVLRNYMKNNQRVRVYVRKEKGVRGVVTGILKIFDKNWNLLLNDACEIWKRRKFRYSNNPTCLGDAKDCSRRLRKLGIKLPHVEVTTMDRKYVECTRRTKQLMIRGEQVVLVNPESSK